MTFGLAVLRQGFPLVQLLRAPGRPGIWEVPLPQIQKARGQSLIPFHCRKAFSRPEKSGLLWEEGSVHCIPTCPLEGAAFATPEPPLPSGELRAPEQGRGRNQLLHQTFVITPVFKSVRRFVCSFLNGAMKKVAKFPLKTLIVRTFQRSATGSHNWREHIPVWLTGSSGPPRAGILGKWQGTRCSSRALFWLCPWPSHRTLVPEEVNNALKLLFRQLPQLLLNGLGQAGS